MTYQETMREGARQYADIINALWRAGLPASFVQTGGMCAAIEVRLDGGATLLITDAEDSLAWRRQEQHGWGVGLYPPDTAYDVEALRFMATEDNSSDSLLTVVSAVLREGAV